MHVVTESDVTERLARRVGGPKPAYPAEALAGEGIELESPLPFEIIVDATGRVEQTRPLSHAGLRPRRGRRRCPALVPILSGRSQRPRRARVRMRWTVDFRFN